MNCTGNLPTWQDRHTDYVDATIEHQGLREKRVLTGPGTFYKKIRNKEWNGYVFIPP
jgi:hypothetical protein